MSDEWSDAVERYIEARLRERHERIERVCEEALAGGEHGVLVVDGVDDLEAMVSPTVPYGCIHYVPKGAPFLFRQPMRIIPPR